MHYAICTVAAAPVRKEPSHRTEMTNQLLFGETMEVLETNDEWLRVQSLYDGYEGWLTHHLVTEIEKAIAIADAHYVATALINPVTLPNQLLNAPMGSILTGFDEDKGSLWTEQYSYHGSYRNVKRPFDLDVFWNTTQAWINAPYLWGGKTFMGVDCSGFVQTVFKLQGIRLQRDAWQQAAQGAVVQNLGDTKTGDVAFFDNEKGKVIHVGIILSSNEIIHSSGNVRIDKIDQTGIINSDHGKRTHQLHSIKRMAVLNEVSN